MSKKQQLNLSTLAKVGGMKLLFDIEKSLSINPPNYGVGIKWIRRQKVKLIDLVIVDDNGNSLQSREKEHVEQSHNDLDTSFKANGVLYDREVMVCKLRKDGRLELHSGYNRLYVLTSNGVSHYFVDVVTYDNPYFEVLWKRRFNSTADHIGKGTPNTEGTYLNGLSEAKEKETLDWESDEKVKEALRFMARGSKTEKQISALLKKWRQTNNPNPFIRGLNTAMANKLSMKMGLPHKGYCKDGSLDYYGQCGFNRYSGDISSKIVTFAKLFDERKVPIKIYGFIEHVVLDQIENQRQEFLNDFNNGLQWIKDHLQPKYHNMVQFEGFHAQDRSKNSEDGGLPIERGIVDVKGNIILDLDPSLLDPSEE